MHWSEKLQPLAQWLKTPLAAIGVLSLAGLALVWCAWTNIQSIAWPPHSTTHQAFQPPHHVDINQLSNYHLMGASASSLGDLPLASLGVTLVGIFSDNSNGSTALIALSSGNSKLYHTGDQLAPNVTIEKILPYSVIVQHNGRLEKLTMPIQPLQFNQQLPSSGLW